VVLPPAAILSSASSQVARIIGLSHCTWSSMLVFDKKINARECIVIFGGNNYMKIMSTFCQEVKAITSDITKFDS
jgi:hypothetical protein